ncbi:MAG: YCF48-related protein [Gammaproteobacteria bacterium]|jgi:photosystem II stability/assembly factor-like uncharacterized protein
MVHEGTDAPSRLLVATMRGVVLLDADESSGPWRTVNVALEGRHVSALLFDRNARRLYAGTHDSGIFASDDFGETWTQASHGLTRSNVFSLAVSVRDGRSTLLAGTEPVMLFSSTDDGRSWHAHPAIEKLPGREKWTFPAPPHDAHLKAITVDPIDPDVYYACIEQGALLRTSDAGESWTEIASYYRPDDRWYRDIHKIVPFGRDPQHLIMSTGFGVYRTFDGGESWEKLTGEDFAIAYPDHLIVSPHDSATVFVSGAATTPNVWRETGVAGAMVQRSRDGGVTWQRASDGLPVDGRSAIEAMSVAVEPDRYTLFVANTDGEVYASDDEASTWRAIAKGLAPVSKCIHAVYVT